MAPGDHLLSVRVEPGGAWLASAPAELFTSPGLAIPGTFGVTYDVLPDGQRFLVIKPVAGNEPTPASTSLVPVQNWLAQLEGR